MKIEQIKLNGVAFSATYVQSFAKESEFVASAEKEFFRNNEPKDRRTMLKKVYRIGKSIERQASK